MAVISRTAWRHLILPATVLAAALSAAWSRYLRRAMRDTIARPFMRAARARGLSERTLLLHHALPNALPTFVTVVLLDVSMMASGAVVTESIFAWPGARQPLHRGAGEARLHGTDGVPDVWIGGRDGAQPRGRPGGVRTRPPHAGQGMSARAVPREAAPRVALLLLGALLLGALVAPVVAPYAVDALDLANRRAAPSSHHWFGTDELGRDLLTRVLFGARVSLAIGLISAMVSAAIGAAVGSIAGYAGGWVGRRVDAAHRCHAGDSPPSAADDHRRGTAAGCARAGAARWARRLDGDGARGSGRGALTRGTRFRFGGACHGCDTSPRDRATCAARR